MYNLNFPPIFYEKRALFDMQNFTHIPNTCTYNYICENKIHLKYPQKYLPRFTPRETADMAPLPIKRALQTDILTIASLPIVIIFEYQFTKANKCAAINSA